MLDDREKAQLQRGAPAAPRPVRLRRRWELPASVALWVVALAVAVQGFVRILARPLADRLPDLHVYVTAVSSFVHGSSLYGLHGSLRSGFTYPPFAALVLLAPAHADEPNGPPVGEGAPTFDVDDVTGPHKGETLCYV